MKTNDWSWMRVFESEKMELVDERMKSAHQKPFEASE